MKLLNVKLYLGILLMAVTMMSCEKESIPKVSTIEIVTDITYSSAIVGGDVTDDGGSAITAKGIVWSTTSNPTLSASFSVDDNLTVGQYNHALLDLDAGTTYFARAYATNSEGTAYGKEITFTTLELSNFISYDGVTYDMGGGYFGYYGQWVGTNYNYDLILYSSGLNWVEEIEYFTGIGHVIYFEMFSSSQTNIESGVYTYDPLESYDPNTFDSGFLMFNFNPDLETVEVDADIVGGTVTVVTSGSNYEITVDCTDSFNKTITAYFQGTLSVYDWSSWKSPTLEKRVFNVKR